MRVKKKVEKGGVYKFPIKGFELGMGCVYKLNYRKGYFYIGATACFYTRMARHKNGLRTVCNSGCPISVEILELVDSKEKLPAIEKQAIHQNSLNFKMLNFHRGGTMGLTKKMFKKLGIKRESATPSQMEKILNRIYNSEKTTLLNKDACFKD